MKFEIGKFYKAGSKTENFIQGEMLLCVDINIYNHDAAFYSTTRGLWFVDVQSYQDFEEWREPREFIITRHGELFEWSNSLKLNEGESIKLREVL